MIARIIPIPINIYPSTLFSPKKIPASINPKARLAKGVRGMCFLVFFEDITAKAIRIKISARIKIYILVGSIF